MTGLLRFSGSSSDYSSSKFVIFGAPFDSTTSFRSGQRFGPNRIREASSTLERFVYTNQTNFKEIGVYDMGDVELTVSPDKMIEHVHEATRKILSDGKFPIMLGGEHSVSIGASLALREFDGSILFLDAHPDFRDSLLGERLSHGSVAKRSIENLSLEKVAAIGLRSISMEEFHDPTFKRYNMFTTDDVRREGVEKIVEKSLTKLNSDKIYLSLDLDIIDPAFAPGVATPEPFGLDPFQIREIIKLIGKKLVGADIVEIDPPYDNGNTAILAARFVQEIISSKTSH